MSLLSCEWIYPEAPSPRTCRHCGRSEWDPMMGGSQASPASCPALSQRMARGEAYNRERLIDEAVRRVMARGEIRQGYMGNIPVGRLAVQTWLDQGAHVSAWWFAFVSHAQAEYRALFASQRPA